LFKSFTLLLAGFGFAIFLLLMLLSWTLCTTWMKIVWVFILVGIAYLSLSLATANNSQANNEKSTPNSTHYPVMRVRAKIASDTYNKPDYSQADAYCCFRLHTLTLPLKVCIRLYKRLKGVSTRNEENRTRSKKLTS